MSLIGFGIIVIPTSSSKACGLSIGNKEIFEIVIQKFTKYKQQHEKDQQTKKSFDKLYRKSLQDNLLDEKKMNLYVIVLLDTLRKRKKEYFS